MTGQELIKKIHLFEPGIECHILLGNDDSPFSQILNLCDDFSDVGQEFSFCTEEKTKEKEKIYTNEMESSKNMGLGFSFQKEQNEGDGFMTERELRSLNRKELLEIMIEQGKEMENRKAQYEKDLAFLNSEHDKDLELVKEENQKDMDMLKSKHEKDMDMLKTKYKNDIELVKEENQKSIDMLKSKYENDLELVKEENEKNLDMLKDKYEKEIASLKEELQEAKKAVQDRSIAIDEAGSIAMAALKLNGVFEAAQAASQQYIENIRCLSERQASICAKRDAENRAENERRIKETADKCANMEYASRRKCETMETEAREKSEAYWAEVSQRLQSFYDNHEELKKLLNFSIPNNFNMGGNKL